MPLMPATERRLTALLAGAQSRTRTPTLVAGLAEGTDLVWTGSAGRLPDGVAASDYAFRIGSITKTFTAVLVMRLVAEGRVGLDDRLDQHVDGTPYGDRTLRQLLTHKGGLTAEAGPPWWERSPGRSWRQITEETAAGALIHVAGERFHYSNLGFGALGQVVARLRGRSWWDCVQAELLMPLGMMRTAYLPPSPFAQGYAVHPFADLVTAEPHTDTADLAPAGQLWSTVGDLVILGNFLINGHAAVLDATWTARMIRWQSSAEPAGEVVDAFRSGYGLGVMIQQVRGTRRVGHFGSMPGFLAGLLAEPGTGRVGVSLGNATAGAIVAPDLLDEWASAEPVMPGAWSPVAAADVPPGVAASLGTWFLGPRVNILHLRGTDLLELTLPGSATGFRFRRDGAGVWRGLDEYYAGEALTLPADGQAPGAVLDVGSFCLTRRPYDSDAEVPGGSSDWSD
jgi:CubicO group peptidase (beta-lactamase class C family)